MNIGAGGLRTVGRTDNEPLIEGELRVLGVGFATGLLIGGTPVDGLTIGGGVFYQIVIEPDVEVRAGRRTLIRGTAVESGMDYLILGPFIDWYPNPSKGFHLGGMPGVSTVGLEDDEENPSSGFGIAAWVGYQWWVAREWSIGPMLRFSASRTRRELSLFDERTDWVDSTLGYAVEFTVLWH